MAYEFNPKTFGEKLKAARIRKKMTQEELASKMGVSKTTIVSIENGAQTKGTNTETAAKLCEILNISLDEVCGIAQVECEPTKEKILDALKTLLSFLPCKVTFEKNTDPFTSAYADNVDFSISFNDAVLAYYATEFKQARRAIDANADTPYYDEIESAILKGFDSRFEGMEFDKDSRRFYLPGKYAHVDKDGVYFTDIPGQDLEDLIPF